jgi:protein ImuA
MSAVQETLQALRRSIAAIEPAATETGQRFTCGAPAVDELLGGGFLRAAVHEIFAREAADAGAAAGFTAGLAARATADGRRVIWVRQGFCVAETGALHAPGLAALGLDPRLLVVVTGPDAACVLQAGAEALRCPALGAVVIEPWGDPRSLDLTASRRLALAAEQSGVPALLLRIAAMPRPSAAATRWSVAAAPSRPLLANTPGHPAFDITLLRHRSGLEGRRWRLEWHREHRLFHEPPPLPRPVVPLPAGRPASPGITRLARTG